WSVADGTYRAHIDQQLQRAQVDPSGELIVGIGDQGAAALVLSARSGKLLARWPLAHEPPTITQDGFNPPSGDAAWSFDGTSITTRSTRIVVWPGMTELPADIVRLIQRDVTWGVDNSQLVQRARVRVHGL